MENNPGNAGNPRTADIPTPPPMRGSSSISAHRPRGIQLPDDPREAAAGAIALLRGQNSINRASAAEALTSRLATLSVANGRQTLDELSAQLPVLEALFLRFAGEAASIERAEHKAIFVKVALSAQAAFARTVALLAALRLQRGGDGRVLVENFPQDS
jgi:hypothetical protein